MKNIRKKNLYTLLTGILMLLSAVAFLAFNNKPANNAFAAGESPDINYSIKMSEGGASVKYGNNSVSFSALDDGGYKSGLAGGSYGTAINFIAEAQRYYEIENYTVTWEEGKTIEINDEDNSSGILDGQGSNVKILIESGAITMNNVIIVFRFKKCEYKINSAAKYISNYQISAENQEASGVQINLTNLIGEEITTVKLGDKITLNLNDNDSSRRFVNYALWNTLEGKYEKLNLFRGSHLKIREEFLDKYLSAKGEILIIGTFINVYPVKISDYAGNLTQNFIEVTLYNNLTKETIECKNKNDIERYFGENSEPVDEGCYIRIVAKNIPYYKFVNFDDGATLSSNIEYRIDYLKDNYDIAAAYSKNVYTLENVDVKDNFGTSLQSDGSGGGVVAEIYNADSGQTTETNQFGIGDKITIKLSESLVNDLKSRGFFDNYFSVKIGATQKYQDLEASSILEITVDSDFLNKYLNLNTDKIRIISNFIHRYSFELILDGKDLGNCSISVNEKNPETYSGNFEKEFFNNGTIITIKSNPSKYASYNFDGVYDRKEGDEITIVINGADRSATLSFIPKVLSLTDKSNIKEDYSVTGLGDLKLGSVLTMTVSSSSSNEIKSWTFNGINVLNEKELLSNMEYSSGVLSITVTEAWLNSLENLEIINNVSVGLKSALLVAIIIPSIVVPLLAIVLLAFIITNAKRKKFIRAELTEKGYAEATRNVSGFIAGLREGKDMREVTDEDVKREMKKRKDKDKQ